MVVRGVDVTTSRRRRFAAQRPGLRTSDPAHFGAGRLEGAAPQTRPGQARRQQHQHEAGNPEAGHSVEIAPEHAPSALETRPHHACKTTPARSEEHTSELQSLMRTSYAVFCLKKKNTKIK